MAPQHVPREILGQTLGQVLGHELILLKLLLSGAQLYQLFHYRNTLILIGDYSCSRLPASLCWARH
jgi:hypothetical protein